MSLISESQPDRALERQNLSRKQSTLVDDLNLITDPHERLSALVSRANKSALDETEKIEVNRVAGCVSRVWVVSNSQEGMCLFRCDADSPMVKGLVALLCDLYSGASPAEVVAVEPEVWAKCGFERLLSPTRLNGLKAVRERIRSDAQRMLDGK